MDLRGSPRGSLYTGGDPRHLEPGNQLRPFGGVPVADFQHGQQERLLRGDQGQRLNGQLLAFGHLERGFLHGPA